MADETAVRRRAPTDRQEDVTINGHIVDDQRIRHIHGEKLNSKVEAPNTALATTILSPVLLTTLLLIFGGCCSNVYTLESILKLSPATGTLVTFLQFLLTSFFTLRTQVTTQSTSDKDKNHGRTLVLPRLRKRIIPISKWLIYTGFFLTINILNNAAFNYKISIPLHIILRSAGPVTSMLVGYFVAGRRYTPRQIAAVILLFSGVVLAALSDAQNKSRPRRKAIPESTEEMMNLSTIAESIKTTKLSEQAPGFVLLFSALLLSAIMGIYTDNLYSTYGRSTAVTNENIFYSHTLSLPFFAVQSRTLRTQFNAMTSSISSSSPMAAPSSASPFLPPIFNPLFSNLPHIPFLTPYLLKSRPSLILTSTNLQSLIKPLFLLLANALTQIVCILGVNRLSTQTTSLTVSIVLNIRKLVSLLLSIWLFGNRLPGGVILGAALVFLGGGLYGFKGRETKKMGNSTGGAESRKDVRRSGDQTGTRDGVAGKKDL